MELQLTRLRHSAAVYQNNFLHVLVNNARTDGPTKLSLYFHLTYTTNI